MSHNFHRGSFFHDAPFASLFLPSPSSSFPSHFHPHGQAHISDKGRGTLGVEFHCWNVGWGGGRERGEIDDMTQWSQVVRSCDHVHTWSHDMLTSLNVLSSTSSTSTPPSLPLLSSQHQPQPSINTLAAVLHLLHPCAPPSKDVGCVHNCQHIPSPLNLVDKDSPPHHQPNTGSRQHEPPLESYLEPLSYHHLNASIHTPRWDSQPNSDPIQLIPSPASLMVLRLRRLCLYRW